VVEKWMNAMAANGVRWGRGTIRAGRRPVALS
jgi:hypothetical protein